MFSADLGVTPSSANYIEDVFSTYLYTGNGSTGQTITNGIDLSGKGGMVWIKSRSNATKNTLSSTASSNPYKYLSSNSTDAESTSGYGITSFNSSGFFIEDVPTGTNGFNGSGYTYTSWTFRKQAKFFDVVTVTADGSGNLTANHNLGSVPGSIFIKRTDGISDWDVWHRSLTATQVLKLNTTAAAGTRVSGWMNATSSSFTTSSGYYTVSGTYVAYLFAHDAGGFGATGSDNVISCGSFSGAANTSVNLGYEPQFVLWKNTTTAGVNWGVADNMRELNTTGTVGLLVPNTADSETSSATTMSINSTGFTWLASAPGATYIYIAIRRGPMKTPTTGTSVFSPIASSAATGTTLTTSFPVDAQIFSLRTGTTNKNNTYDRLRGVSSTTTESGVRLITSSIAAETAAGNETRLWNNTSFQMPSTFGGASTVFWNFGRAPGFFDVVCYTGDGTVNDVNHNLGVVPELIIGKRRNAVSNWAVYSSTFNGGVNPYQYVLYLNSTAALPAAGNYFLFDDPTATRFRPTTVFDTIGGTYVAYLFATLTGVSKVGTYTGTGTTQQINCGFTTGARFVLIKCTDVGGNWYVWDSARGIVAGNDPYLLLNSTAAEVTSTDYIDTYSAGFEISSTAIAEINGNGAKFIFLAIA